MCDYSLHAMATRPAVVGETLISTTFRGTSTRGFASETRARGRGLHAARDRTGVRARRQIRQPLDLDRTIGFRVGKFNTIDPHIRERHHDAIEFPDGSHVLVTQLCEGQRVTVLQLPVVHPIAERATTKADTATATPLSTG